MSDMSEKRKGKKKDITNIILTSIIVISVLIYGGLFIANYIINNILSKVGEGEEIDEVVEVYESDRNVVNFALFGVDMEGAKSQYDELRSDAIKIISLDYDNHTIKITSLERDMVVYYPVDEGELIHLNWAYWYGGAKDAVKTLNYNFDMDINRYVSISFGILVDIIDEIDGIDLELSEAEADALFRRKSEGAGTYHLSGKEALTYSRIRSIDNDFKRINRQNQVIMAVVNKVKGLSLLEIYGLINEILPSVNTNLSTEEIRKYLTDVTGKVDLNHIETYTEPSGLFYDIKASEDLTGYDIGGYVIRSYSEMVKDLHVNIYGETSYTPSQTVQLTEDMIYENFGDFENPDNP